MISGVYFITNIVNGNKYIGSSVNVTRRWHDHVLDLRNNRHNNKHLQAAWNKYGAGSFAFSMLCFCEKPQLLVKEQEFLENCNPEYNIAKDASAPMLGRRHTAEARAKISLSKQGVNNPNFGKQLPPEIKAKIRVVRIGAIHSDATKQKMSDACVGEKNHNFGKKLSSETRRKMSEVHLGKPRSPEVRAKISATKRAKAMAAAVTKTEQDSMDTSIGSALQ